MLIACAKTGGGDDVRGASKSGVTRAYRNIKRDPDSDTSGARKQAGWNHRYPL